MKSLRFPAFRYSFATVSALLTLSSGQLWSVPATWVGGSTDWGNAASWTRTPAGVPTVADTAIFAVHSSSNTDPHNVQLRGNRQILGITPTNAATTDSLNILGGDGNYTLGIGAGGITHTRSAMVIGSVTDGQKVNISLLDNQTWTSSATAGNAAAAAMFILNDVSIGSGGNQTLTLTGLNTGSKIDGAISDGAGVLGLTKNGTGTSTQQTDSTWTLNGPVSYSGPTTVLAGKLRLKSTLGLDTNLVTMSPNTLLELTVGGATGMPGAKLESLLKTGTFPITTSLELNNLGPIFLNTTGPGEFKLTKLGAPELTLFGVSSRNSLTAINAGILRIRDLQSGGVPSSIGASSSDAANLTFGSGARLLYDGPAASSDRLFTYSGNFTIESAGSGPLQFTNTGTLLTGAASTRTLTLIGSNHGDNLIRPKLGANDELPNTTTTSLTKRGGGTWRILGANTIKGTTRVDEGTLIFDFSAGDPFQSPTLLLNGGTTILRGTGATAKSITTLNLGAPIVSSSHFKLENGLALTSGTLATSATQRNDLIDLSGHANNSLTITTGLGGTLANVNGIVMANGTTSQGRASTVLRAQDGTYGFLALSGGTTGTAVKAGPLTQRVPGTLSMTSDTTNYLLKVGDYTATTGENLVFSTAVFDSSDGPINLNVGAVEIKPSGQGKALLFTGDNSVTFTGNFGNDEAGDDTAIWFHNYLETGSSLNLDVGLGTASQTVIFGGSGLTLYSGTGFVGNFLVNDGVFRYTKDQAIPLSTNSPIFKIGNGAVLEVGARLQSSFVGPPDLVKKVGADPGGIRFYGDAGLSAYTTTAGGTRIAYFSTIEYDVFGDPILVPQPLTWGSSYFLTVSESDNNVDGDNAFKLSSDVSNATIEVQNTIYLNGKVRTLEVANGSATIDAKMSGSLMGLATPGDTASGIVKKGPGTLQLTGVNFYKGETRVMEGTLMIIGGALDPQSRLWIDSGAKLFIDPNAINANAVHVAEVYIDGVQQFGTITHPSIIGGGTLISDAPITPYGQWVINKNLGTTESAPTYDYDLDGIRNLMEYAVGTEPKVPNGSVLSITGTSTRQIKFNHASGRTDIIFALDSSPDLASPWTTIARSTGGAAFTSAATGVVVSEVSNQVTVTDNRTPAATVMFYRLRVEK